MKHINNQDIPITDCVGSRRAMPLLIKPLFTVSLLFFLCCWLFYTTAIYAADVKIISLHKIADDLSFLQNQYSLSAEQLAAVRSLRGKKAAIPQGQGSFTQIINPVFSLDKTYAQDFAFIGKGDNNQHGLYIYQDGKIKMVVNQSTNIPNGVGFFDKIRDVSFDARHGMVAFVGEDGLGLQGIYLFNGKKLVVAIDQDSLMPVVQQNFSKLYKPSLQHGVILFYGTSGKYNGIYIYDSNGDIFKVISNRDTVDKKFVQSFALGQYAFQGALATFGVVFRGGLQAVYTARLQYQE